MHTILKVLFVLLFLWLPTGALGQAVSDRVIRHTIRSEYLGGEETAIHVLRPSTMEEGKRYPVLYLLPVIDGDAAWGKPFEIAQEENFPDKYGVICVMWTSITRRSRRRGGVPSSVSVPRAVAGFG